MLAVESMLETLQKVMPEAVQADKNGYKTVSYTDLIPVLIEAIKQQQVEINELKNKGVSPSFR